MVSASDSYTSSSPGSVRTCLSPSTLLSFWMTGAGIEEVDWRVDSIVSSGVQPSLRTCEKKMVAASRCETPQTSAVPTARGRFVPALPGLKSWAILVGPYGTERKRDTIATRHMLNAGD